MSASDTNLGYILDVWLAHLDQAGFQIGVRERLRVQALLAQLSAAGELSQYQTLEAIFTLIKPLLCTGPEQQRKYTTLLAEFAAQQTKNERRSHQAEQSGQNSECTIQKERWKFRLWHGVLLALLMIATVIGVNEWEKPSIAPFLHKIYSTVTETGRAEKKPDQIITPKPLPYGLLSPVLTFELVESSIPVVPEWSESIRVGLRMIGAASLLILIGMVWAHWRRQLYLQGIRTDQEIEEYALTDPNPVQLEPVPAMIRQAARILRQRQTGEQLALHIQATLNATLKTGGVLSPRYRALSKTPEYLALIDQRHPADHHAVTSKALLQALIAQGVAIQILYFEGSPQTGCWQSHAGSHDSGQFGLISFSELAARYSGYRLLIFADAQALVDEISGQARRWASYFNAFPQRAWFTPMPMASWGWMEQVLDEQNFLVLPVQPESLMTAATWFSAGQLELEVGADWPLHYPPLLRENALTWVIQQTAPPPAAQEELLFQLRNFLGAQRFQWLCACSIFPAISPAMTLAFGRELSADTRDLMLGTTALGALPWFRYAFMPAWLRMLLIERLNASNEAHFRQIIETRLTNALTSDVGTPLLTLAQRKRQLTAWLHRCGGPARDVVMVDFLQRGLLVRLAQRLPEGLRKRLFRQGLPAYGFSRSAIGVLLAGLLLGLLGWKGESIFFNQPRQLQAIKPVPLTLVLIPSGSFNMGDPPGQPVRIDHAFYLGKYEVTYAQYDYYIQDQQQKGIQAEIPDTGPGGRGNQPVVNVRWHEAIAYAKWLSEQVELSCRLPTDAEWEYAARAGTQTTYPWGDELGSNHANCDGCGSPWDGRQSAPVGSFAANRFGLHDMSGNVWEWTCSNWRERFDGSEQQCNDDTTEKQSRVLRGGSWDSNPDLVRASVRPGNPPDFRGHNFGFRVLCLSPIE